MVDPSVREKLKPGRKPHARVVQLLRNLKQHSDSAMTDRRKQFDVNEETYRAYIDLEAASEARRSKATPESEFPGTVPIVIPMAMAGVHAYLSFLMGVFGSRKPIISLSGRSKDDVEPANLMESVIDWQMNHIMARALLKWFHWFEDALIYGCGFLLNEWQQVIEPAVKWGFPQVMGVDVPFFGKRRTVEDSLVFEGNVPKNLYPQKCYPDPSVPLTDIQKGRYFGYVYGCSVYELEKDVDTYFNLEYVQKDTEQGLAPGSSAHGDNEGRIQDIIKATSNSATNEKAIPGFPHVFECWAKISPKELMLSDETDTQVWVFALADDKTVIRAERTDQISAAFPVSAIEFIPCGHQFMNQGFVEIVQPLQEHFSWLFNTRMTSVRNTLNQTTIYDPTKLESSDVHNKEFIRFWRMKPEAYGLDLRTFVHRLDVSDPMSNYTGDLMVIWDIYQRLTGITDAIQGLPAKGRRTALEMGGVQAAAAGRLKLVAEIFSMSGVIPFAKQVVKNTQQYMSQAMFTRLVGENIDPNQSPVEINPWDIAGEFDYPITDGTAPLDKYRMAEVWREILIDGSKNPILAQQIDFWKVFQQVGRTLGIKNIDDFRIQNIQPSIMGDEQAAAKAKAGNIVPIGGKGGEGLEGLAAALGAGRPGQKAA